MILKLLIVVLLLFGYVNTAGGSTLIVTKCNDNKKLRIGDYLEVHLESQITSGYLWRLATQSSGSLELLGPPETVWPQDGPNIDGASELQLFRFKANKVGIDVLLFHSTHPWSSSDKPPLATCMVTASIH